MTASTLIAIDWGTSAARAYRLDATGEVRGERSAALGIARVHEGRYAEALDSLLGEWRDDPAPRLACGMIGSRQGWIEAPYVECPASLDRLASAIAAVKGHALSIVPGLTTRDRYGMPDVMRGEETQLVGAVGTDESSVLAVLPGTHSKWAHVDRGRVIDFTTFMTGELFAVMIEHSILGRPAQRDRREDIGRAFERGVRRGLERDGFAHAIFGARTLALTGEIVPGEISDWLSGTLIGREIRDAVEWARERRIDASRVRIVGSDDLSDRYQSALALASIDGERSGPHAAARGLWRIAGQAGLLH